MSSKSLAQSEDADDSVASPQTPAASILQQQPLTSLPPALSPAQGGKFDGLAELPRVYVKSALADTPAPGKHVLVKNSQDLQTAIDNAACGDTIELQAGAEFMGSFKFPAKRCDDAHWIILRTSANDRELPPEGTRLTPCYAGVASLPGRPDFHCSSSTPKNVLARIIYGRRGGPDAIQWMEGANHYRFVGLEITRTPDKILYVLIGAANRAAYDHIVFDRVWVHGTPQDETVRGIALGSGTYVAVVDSFFTDFHCVALAACTDAQTINGGLGDKPMGPYKIVNNFLEAAGENILFGGGGATLSPADIEIRRNFFFKPMIWRKENPNFAAGYNGKPFVVKNLFELKNAQRVLLEGNVLEGSWGGFTQKGFAILFTPKNQNGHCPLCKITDVTFRFNKIRHAASGMQMGTGLAGGALGSGAGRYSIHDNIFEDIDGANYGGLGAFLQVTSTQPAFRDVTIAHNTAFPSRVLFIMGVGVDREKAINFNFTDNLVSAGTVDIMPPGGGPKNCAFQPKRQGPSGVLGNCFASFNVTGNVIIGSWGGWPKGNSYPKDMASAGVVEVESDLGKRYQVCRDKKTPSCQKTSLPAVKATDGKDVGADVEAVGIATAGVD